MKNALLLTVILASTIIGTLVLAGCGSGGSSDSDYKAPPASATSSNQSKAPNKAMEAK